VTSNCIVCNSVSSFKFFEKLDYPVQDGLLYPSAEEALKAPTGSIELCICDNCGYIWNRSFEEKKIRYDTAYEISLAASPVYRDFLNATAQRLSDRYITPDSHAIEIGCGDGSFLQILCSIAGCSGTGFDPTFKSQETSNERVQFISSFFPDSESLNHCDLLCCRHVLQQVLFPSNPATFLNTIRNKIQKRSDIKMYFEVPNASFIFTPDNIWNIVYEYHSYFTESSLSRLFLSAGFEILEVKSCFKNGQYLGLEAANSNSKQSPFVTDSSIKDQLKDFQTFYHETLASWRDQLSKMFDSYKRIAAWGAGGRAISFFNALQVNNEIPYVADINIHRQGKFLPVTGQQVVSPEFLVDYNPEGILITNRTFEQEIRNQIADLGISPAIFSF
jgi:hypothetical protein